MIKLESYAELIGTSDSAAVRRYLDYLFKPGHGEGALGLSLRK